MEITAEEYLKLVHAKFNDCMKKRLSRRDLEWGVFSGQINRDVREQLKKLSPESKEAINLKLAFGIWQAMSRILELNHQSKIKKIIFSGKYEREIESLKKAML